MSYIYISDSRLSRGGVKLSEKDLSSLPDSVLKKAISNKVIKKKNERRAKEDQEG